MAQADSGEMPVPRTAEGKAGLAAIQQDPAAALIATDFDGTLAPIVADPREARADPGVAAARERLPGVLADTGADEGVRVEDKGSALAVHTRRAADPAGALAALREPLAGLAADVGLVMEPGRLVIELRPPGMDKGAALTALVAERKAGPVLFAGDDLGDLAAFGAVRALRGDGHPGVTVCSASGEVSELAAEADLVVDGPGGVAALLGSLARSLSPPPRPAP